MCKPFFRERKGGRRGEKGGGGYVKTDVRVIETQVNVEIGTSAL